MASESPAGSAVSRLVVAAGPVAVAAALAAVAPESVRLAAAGPAARAVALAGWAVRRAMHPTASSTPGDRASAASTSRRDSCPTFCRSAASGPSAYPAAQPGTSIPFVGLPQDGPALPRAAANTSQILENSRSAPAGWRARTATSRTLPACAIAPVRPAPGSTASGNRASGCTPIPNAPRRKGRVLGEAGPEAADPAGTEFGSKPLTGY